jgi:hypothetical protein
MTDEDLANWLGTQTWSEFAQSLSSFFNKRGYLSEKQRASAQSMYTKCMAREAAKATTASAPAGAAQLTEPCVCKVGDKWYRARWNRAKTNLYAERIVVTGEGENASVSFTYVAGMIRKLTTADRVTMIDAKEFGMAFGCCCNCGRKLTTSTSIEHGYGPVCAAHNGWPYGDSELD